MKKGISYSSWGNYLTCPRKYEIEKVEGYEPKLKSSALVFGSAFDDAVNDLVINGDLDKANRILIDGIKCLVKNTDHYFFKNDFDYDLLTKEQDDMAVSYLENELNYQGPHSYETLHEILMKYVYNAGNDYNILSENQQLFLSFISTMSLKQKGYMMLEAFQRELIPSLESIEGVQVELSSRRGFIDIIANIKGHGRCIIDVKTTSRAYTQDQLDFSPQLSIYSDDQKIDKVAYFTVVKNLNKNITKVCSECDYNGTGKRFKTCDNVINGKRCNGKWEVSINPEVVTQMMIDDINVKYRDIVIKSLNSVDDAIDKKVFPMNLQSCANQYGKPCPYSAYCVSGDTKDIKKRET